jgi:hypothetical protein
VIVVIGQPVLDLNGPVPAATGSAARVALAAVARGAPVQLIGKVGEDVAGEALVLALARGGVGHVALLRDATRSTPQLVRRLDAEALEPDLDADDATADAGTIEPADPAQRPGLDTGDVELGLRYLTEFRVIVTADALDEATLRVVAEASSYTGGTLIALVPDGAPEPTGFPAAAIVLQAPADDEDGVFDRLVGELAAAIDGGADPQAAFRDLLAGEGWEPARA